MLNQATQKISDLQDEITNLQKSVAAAAARAEAAAARAEEANNKIAALSSSLAGLVYFAHEDGVCPQGYTDLQTALFPRWHFAFEQNSFITPKDKATSGSWPGNTDWRLDHIKLCTRP
jgi:hypothetical protein